MSKYNRTNFYKQEIISNRLENDMVKNYWDLFKIKRPLRYLSLSRQFIQRPDLLSYSVYGDVSYWWILSKFNQIDDWWNDVVVGTNISIPDVRDIDDFFINVLTLKTRS